MQALGIGIVVGMLAGMVAMLEIGRRFGVRRMAEDPEKAGAGLGAIEGAVFGLMGLLIAFTFSGAGSRFDARRTLLVEEANAIGTAYLRLDLLPPAVQPPLRDAFRRYLDARLAAYRAVPDLERVQAELDRATLIQGEIWRQAVAATGEAPTPQAAMLLLPALNEMIDITTTRTVAAHTHPPGVIYAVLLALALVCSFLAGYGMAGAKRRNWVHMACWALVMTATLYVILDFEYPRLGLIRITHLDQVLVDVRNSMK